MAGTGPAMIWLSGVDKRNTYFNQPWLEYRGRSMEQELGDAWMEGVHPDDVQRYLDAYVTAFDAREDSRIEYRLRRFDGEYRWILCVGTPRYDSDGCFAGYIGSCIDITDRKEAEQALREAQAELEGRIAERTAELSRANAELSHEIAVRKSAEETMQRFTGELLELEDKERRRIARDLHDITGQNLLGALMNLSRINTNAAGLAPELRAALSESLSLVKSSLEEIRTLSYVLHPPLLDELGLGSALRNYAEGFSQRSGIRVHLDVSPRLVRLPAETEIALFRVVQESLTNVRRHSGSESVEIRLVQEARQVTLEVRDKGASMESREVSTALEKSASVGVGITSMRERLRHLGGHLEVTSGPLGTTISAHLPVRMATHEPTSQLSGSSSQSPD